MLDLLKPLWQPVIRFIRSCPAREEQFKRKHAEAYPGTNEYRDEHEALDQPTWAPLFTRK